MVTPPLVDRRLTPPGTPRHPKQPHKPVNLTIPFPTAAQHLYFPILPERPPAVASPVEGVILPGSNLTCLDFESTAAMQSASIQA